MPILNTIRELFEQMGEWDYGEGISQLSHALQCAYLAEQANQTPAFISACLLHDIGHFITTEDALQDEDFPENTFPIKDYAHEKLGAKLLKTHFYSDVTAPIALHVEAKRYLCAVDPVYQATLSEASMHSLQLQGGVMSLKEVSDFQTRKFNKSALLLRTYDDLAKEHNAKTPSLDYFLTTYVALCVKHSDTDEK